MVHALGGPAIGTAVAAGARSIEHGIWLTEADAADMAAAGAFLVPTLGIYRHLAAQAAIPGSLPPAATARAIAAGQTLVEAVRIARAAGVPIALGTDFAHRDMHGRNLGEITELVGAGLSPVQALLAATANGADLCGVGDVTGRLTVGRRLDAIVLDVDPSDPEIFTDPDSVGEVFLRGLLVRPPP
ncbi:imidazolonepropionase-like amidohydrolase [Nakamurella sp. UYEF19]